MSSIAINDRLIICIASNWHLDPTSKHHVMRELSRTNDVVWVNYHGSRKPTACSADARSALSVIRRALGGANRISDKMVQTTPLVIPAATRPMQAQWNRRIVAATVARARRQFGRHHAGVQLWTFAPDVDFLCGAFGEEAVVYYCVDEFSKFAGFDEAETTRKERRLMDRADIILTSASDLYESRARQHEHVHLIRHGVEYARFRQALDRKLSVPDPIARIRKPIVGFVGLIEHWIDIELIAKTAKRLDDVAFVLVGECRTDVTALEHLDNVHLIGRQPYASLPAYLARFDAGIIPFQVTDMTRNVNPIKLREYLAAGLPVISTDLPEVRRFKPHVAIAGGVDEFVLACSRAVSDNGVAARLTRSLSVADQDWSTITSTISKLVADRIRAKRDRLVDPRVCTP